MQILDDSLKLLPAAGQPEASRIAAQIQDLNLRGEPEQPSTPSQVQEIATPSGPTADGECFLKSALCLRHSLRQSTL